MITFFLLIMFMGWTFSYILESPIILIVSVLFSVGMNIVAYWYSDKIVLKTAGAHEADPHQYRELHNIVENLAITAGLPKPKVYVIEDRAPNAFATGRDKEHAVVAATTGLLGMLDHTELEGVMAHELSHIGNRDILISTIVVVLVGFVTLLSDFFLRMAFYGGGGDRDGRVQLFAIIAGIVLSILAPLIATLIQLAISRKREFLADSSGALLTRYPDGLASALKKIEGYQGELKHANHATAHLYISNPFKGKHVKSVVGRLFMTHPKTEDRVKALVG